MAWDACEVLVGAAFVLSAASVLFAVHVRCRATLEDVERHALKCSTSRWYAVRLTTVVVLIGGLLHLRHFVRRALVGT